MHFLQNFSMKNNRTLALLSLIMVVNALSYGTIIPLLYPYATRFGVDALGLSVLFASFSAAQLIATPIVGRMSDKYGRKPLLLWCLGGTSLSLALFASATSFPMLLIARILDGVTGGNNSVAQAMVADSTEGKDRAKSFALLGAAFGCGFLIGPAIGGIMSSIHITAPFWFASALALLGTILGLIFLPETLTAKSKSATTKLSPKMVLDSLFHPLTGIVLLLTLLSSTTLQTWIIGFQTFTNDVLALNTTTVGILFACFGLISIIMQAWGLRVLLNRVKHKRTILTWSLVLAAVTTLPLVFITTFQPFFLFMIVFGVVSSPINAILSTLLSERTKPEDQGGILGINQSYLSLGQIIGPLMAGSIITVSSVNNVFLFAGILYVVTTLVSSRLYGKRDSKLDL